MKTFIGLTFGAAVLAFVGPSQALAWYCHATSPAAYGWGSHGNRSVAVRRALAECAVRTPRYQTCYIRYCR
jgi:hypothetical protein